MFTMSAEYQKACCTSHIFCLFPSKQECEVVYMIKTNIDKKIASITINTQKAYCAKMQLNKQYYWRAVSDKLVYNEKMA